MVKSQSQAECHVQWRCAAVGRASDEADLRGADKMMMMAVITQTAARNGAHKVITPKCTNTFN